MIRIKKRKFKISTEDILWFLILIFYFESQYLARFSILSTLYTGGKLLSIGFILFHIRKFHFNSIMAVIFLEEVALWISTLLAGASMMSVSTQVISVTAFIIVIDIMLKEDTKRCIRILYTIMALLIYINVLSMLFFPNGLYTVTGVVGTRKYYFLGHQNSLGLYATIAIALGEFRLEIEDEDKFNLSRLIFLEIVSLFYILRVWSVISLLSVAGIIAITFFNRLNKKGWHLSLVWSLVFNAVIFIVFVALQNFEMISSFLEEVLNREATLSGRTTVWAIALKYFLNNPIWGVGQGKGYEIFGFATTHNRYVNTIFTGGLIGISLLVILLVAICRRLKNSKESMTKILIAYFTIFLFIIQGETFDDILFYLMFIFVCNVQYLVKAKKIYRENPHIV